MFLTISYSTDSAFSLKALLWKKAETERVTIRRDDKGFWRTRASMNRQQEKMEKVEIVLFDKECYSTGQKLTKHLMRERLFHQSRWLVLYAQ